ALGWVINLFQRGSASLSRLESILSARPAVTPPEPGRLLPPTTGGRTLEFRDVGFYYPGPEGQVPCWVLRHVSFTVPAGAPAALAARPRRPRPQEGRGLVDGVALRAVPVGVRRHAVGLVPQESLLFGGASGASRNCRMERAMEPAMEPAMGPAMEPAMEPGME